MNNTRVGGIASGLGSLKQFEATCALFEFI
jgi:hypothetical protein